MLSRCRNIFLFLLMLSFFLFTAGCSPDPNRHKVGTLPLTGDIIVVGSGIAGLTAALEAARLGAAVILCYDKLQDDSWIWKKGALTAEGGADREPLEDILYASGNGRGKKWHYELLARRADQDLAWLARETGLALVPDGAYGVMLGNISFERARQLLMEKALKEGIRFVEGAALQEFLFSEEGCAAGITFLDPHGVHYTAYAPAVILADGGCFGDPEQLQELDPETNAASWCCSSEGAGIKAAREAGLDLVDERKFSYALAVQDNNNWAAVEPPPGALFIAGDKVFLFSQAAEADLINLLLNDAGVGYLLIAETALDPQKDLNWTRYTSLDAFAEAYEIRIPSLRRWFRQPYGNFYASPVKAIAVYCLGGIAVDKSGAALREGCPVTGFYVIGETAGALNGDALMPGTALTEALVWGRRVGKAAAEWVQE